MTSQELLERYANGERNFSSVDLSGANLIGVVLEDIIFEETTLKGGKFSRSILNRANFRNANLKGTEFDMTSLNKADFRGAYLEGSLIVETSLIRANFEGAIFRGYIPAGGYTFETVMQDGSIDTCDDPGRDKAIALGESGFREST